MSDDDLPWGPKERAIIEALRGGCTREAAAGYAGIHRITLWKMTQRSATFDNACKEAEDYAEAVAIGYIRNAMPKEWQAAAWWLERRHPDKYGRRVAIDISLRDEATRLAAQYGLDPEALLAEAESLVQGKQGE